MPPKFPCYFSVTSVKQDDVINFCCCLYADHFSPYKQVFGQSSLIYTHSMLWL